MSQDESEPLIGIDLGGTYCCVGMWNRETGQVQIVKNSDGQEKTQAVISFEETGEMIVGEQASDDPRCIKDWKEGLDATRSMLKNKESIEQIQCYLLQSMKKLVDDRYDCDAQEAVITVPSYFTAQQK